MNTIELFRKGRKVKTILPDNKTAGELKIGSYIRLNGENFWRRVNSDGTLTKVENGLNGTYNYENKEVPSIVRNLTIKRLGGVHGKDNFNITNALVNTFLFLDKTINPFGKITSAIYNSPFILNRIVRNTEGSGNGFDEALSLATGIFRYNYYDGKLHNNIVSEDWKNPLNIYSTNTWTNDRNIVNLYTNLDDTGFLPSKLGIGSYSGTKYLKFPAYEGNYYGVDTLYLPKESEVFFKNNLGKRYLQDHDTLIKGMKSVEGLDDVLHYGMTPRYINNNYYVDLEDVWDADRGGLDSRNYPFILNLRIPVIFTDDEDKLNITPEFSNWFANPKNWNK